MAQRQKAGEAVIELLRQEGVSHIFGIVGSSFLDILDPLYDDDSMQFHWRSPRTGSGPDGRRVQPDFRRPFGLPGYQWTRRP